MDPIVTDDPPTNDLRLKVRELLNHIAPEITMHDFRVVWGKTHSNVIFDVCVPFGFRIGDAELLRQIGEGIASLNPAYHAVVTVDHSYISDSEEQHA